MSPVATANSRLLMIVSFRGEFGERDPWQTEGGGVCRAPDRESRNARAVGEQTGRAAAGPRFDVGEM